jgi:hypothetical protein
MTSPAPPSGPGAAARPARRRRTRQDRRGRGLRTPLLPPGVPGFRTRAELFDQVVMDAVVDLEARWPGKLDLIEFAVDDVPSLPAGAVISSSDVVVDDGVPLARFFPPGIDKRGKQTKARIVVYRRPLELRAPASIDLIDLVTDVLDEQLSAVLGDGAQ